MKNILNIILLLLFSFVTYAQQKTKITGYISDLKDETALLELQIFYPYDPNKDNLQQIQTEDITTNDGRFELTVEIDKPVSFQGRVNNKWLLLPGTFSTFIFPGDSIHMEIKNSKTPNKVYPQSGGIGITEIDFTGKGSERINFHKSLIQKAFFDVPELKSKDMEILKDRLVKMDKRFDIVDSMYLCYSGSLSLYEKKMIKALVYDGSLSHITYSGLSQENDSIPFYFDKYIFKKNRLAPFFEDDIIFYSGGGSVVGYSLIIKELKTPYKYGGANFRSQKPIEYLNILVKHLKDEPQTRNYLLSQAVKTIFGREINNENTEKAIKIYKENVSSDYILFNKIMELYSNSINNLKPGKPFYSFTLPDTKGKTYKLSDFKGKLLVLDLYFTGCGGCKAMVPYIEQAENELKDLPIQFISVSIDRTKDTWFEGLGEYCSKNSLHLYTEGLAQRHPLIEFLRVVGYPFLVVIDKEGNIVGVPPNPVTNKDDFISFLKDKV